MFERIVVVTKKTPLEELLERHYSREQAAFFLKSRGNDIAAYEAVHARYQSSLQYLLSALPETVPNHRIERGSVASFLFRATDLIIAIGPDGLVANVAKYAAGQPILAVNPDPANIDGVLVRFQVQEVIRILPEILREKYSVDELTLAEATTNDGQRLLAVNDFLVGRRDQISARYTIEFAGCRERQSSSGILVSTGVGSSGWLSSVAGQIERLSGCRPVIAGENIPFSWQAKHLVFVVREPFASRSTGTGIVCEKITGSLPLTVYSEMPEGGVVFSDGVPEDALEFNSGSVLTISLASQRARLIAI